METSYTVDSIRKLGAIYDPPGSLALDKVVYRFDKHVADFMHAATLAVVNLRHADGRFVPLLAGGAPGFVRVLSDTIAEFDISGGSWQDPEFPPDRDSHFQAGFLFLIPGIRETLRMKGRMTASVGQAGRMKLRLELENAFFHCGKALIRSRIWEKPPRPGAWRGLRAFECVARTQESRLIASFELRPVDGELPDFVPGQHVSIELAVEGQAQPVRRVYSLAARPGRDTFRITVKRENGLATASGYMHERVRVGSVVHLRNPAGAFKLELDSTRPVVLLSAGVGLTPVVSMLEHLAYIASRRPVWYFHGAVCGRDHAMGPHVRALADRHPAAHVQIFYSRPAPDDRQGVDFDHRGRLSVNALQALLPSDDYEFYICGPSLFMKSMVEGLIALGVQRDRLNWEAFAGSEADILPLVRESEISASGRQSMVTFSASGKSLAWAPHCKSLLDVAEAAGVPARSSCRSGSCFSCETRLLSGRVIYQVDVEDQPEEDMILLCCARPDGDVVLDL